MPPRLPEFIHVGHYWYFLRDMFCRKISGWEAGALLAMGVPGPADKCVCQLPKKGRPQSDLAVLLLPLRLPFMGASPSSHSPTMGFFQSLPLLSVMPLTMSSSILMVSLAPLCRWRASRPLPHDPFLCPRLHFHLLTGHLHSHILEPLGRLSVPKALLHLCSFPSRCAGASSTCPFQSGLPPVFQEFLSRNVSANYQKSTESLLCNRQPAWARDREMNKSYWETLGAQSREEEKCIKNSRPS